MNRQDRLRALPIIWIMIVGMAALLLTGAGNGWNGVFLIGMLVIAGLLASAVLLSDRVPSTPANEPHPVNELWTARERQILYFIVQGYSNEEIARELVIALSTVKTHINNIYRKLGVQSRAQAVRRGLELNIAWKGEE